MGELLIAKDLCKTFSNENTQQHVLKNLNVTVNKGDFTVVMGNSGSGKSTLLYALSGMDRPTLGSITYDGEEISKYNNDKLAMFRRKHCGFVFQHNYLNDTMSILDNIMVSGLLVSKDRKDIAERAKVLLKKVGLDEKCYGKFPTQLSGGEQQRVAIARALAKRPKLLLCDEPTGALDYQTGKNILKLLQDTCRKEKMTVVLVTHNSAITPMADRVIRLKNSKVESITLNNTPASFDDIEW